MNTAVLTLLTRAITTGQFVNALNKTGVFPTTGLSVSAPKQVSTALLMQTPVKVLLWMYCSDERL